MSEIQTARSPAWIRQARILAARMADAAARSEHGDEAAQNTVFKFNLGAIIIFVCFLIGVGIYAF